MAIANRYSCHSKFFSTFYWRATNKDYPGGRTVTIGTCAGKPIAKVNKNFADNIVMEGSARLNNGIIVNSGNCNCGKGYNCFVTLDPKLFEWGESARGTPLRPFVRYESNYCHIPTFFLLPLNWTWISLHILTPV